MKIASFLPSATEILFALGAADEICGVTFECDYPAAAQRLPVVVHSAMQAGLTPAEIDRVVRETAHAGGSLYFVDWERLQALAPELVIAQDLCRICAIDSPSLARDLGQLARPPQVLSLEPHGLENVLADIETVGAAIGRAAAAAEVVRGLRARIDAVRAAAQRSAQPRPRVLCLEWLDPLYQGGHWIPEMVEIAGGEAVLAKAGGKSVRITWEQVFAADPELLVLMPCGYHLAETIAQYEAMTLPNGWYEMTAVRRGDVYAVDGTAYFSRPGPRLIDGLEILWAILSGEGWKDLPVASVARLG